MADVDRANLSVHAANLVRDRYARVEERVSRKGRPRQRFLAERRSQTANALSPSLAALAAITGTIAAVNLATDSEHLRIAAIVQACVAIGLGAATLAVPFVRKKTVPLVTLAAGTLGMAMLGWGLSAHLSGGASSPWLLVIPIVVGAGVGFVPMPLRVAAGLAVTGYLALLVASPAAPLWVHFLVAATAAATWVAARTRHRRNIASFRRIERLSSNVARLRRMQQQLVLVEKLEALRVLVGGMAHELNNALAVAMASTQQAAKMAASNPEQAAAAMRRADGGLGRIRATIERLRRFAMASEGVLEPADVAAMLDFALESAIGRARSGVSVERDYDPQIGTVKCHVAQLAEGLYQIARNAIEAMPAGGRLRATVRAEGNKVVLTLADEGKGMTQEALKHVFDPYWRHTQAANRSGMGLSAVYGIVTSLGGSVRVQSGEGKGTTVSILLPRHS